MLEITDLRCEPMAGVNLPLVVQPGEKTASVDAAGLAGWIQRDRPWIDEQLLAHGAILFRGFDALRSAGDFEVVARTVSTELMDYIGGASPRTRVRGEIFTSTDAPAFFPISPHQELSYQSTYPDWVLFFCETPPARGGQTPLVDMRAVHGKLAPDVKERFASRGVQLHRLLFKTPHRGQRPWPEVFGTRDQETIEGLAASWNWRLEWLESGNLRVINEPLPASLDHPVTGEAVWFNQAHLLHPSAVPSDYWYEKRYGWWLFMALARRLLPSGFHHEVRHADGGRTLDSDLDHIRAVMREETVQFDWQRGDLLWLDNYLIAHGRRTFTGPRRILAALLRDDARRL